jgi:hypothetical protein
MPLTLTLLSRAIIQESLVLEHGILDSKEIRFKIRKVMVEVVCIAAMR